MVNEIDCFGVSGGAGGRVEAQSMLPDISDFQLLGLELKHGCDCQKWQKTSQVTEMAGNMTP